MWKTEGRCISPRSKSGKLSKDLLELRISYCKVNLAHSNCFIITWIDLNFSLI